MKRLEKLNQHLQKSVNFSCVVSLFAGSMIKILVVLVVVIYYSFVSHTQDGNGVTIEAFKSSYPSGIESPPIMKYFSALIAAPIIENLVLPLTVWLVEKLKTPMILGFLCLGGLMYFAHAQGGESIFGGIGACVMFTFILAQYLLALNTHGKRNAYWFTVVTHFAYNLTTFAFIHILNLIILYL